MRTKKDAAKEIIINAAWELFQEKGYEETTLKDIIERSGTSRGAFYHNFRSKEDVLFMMAWYFDKEYDGWLEKQDPEENRLDLLMKYLMYSSESVENSEYKSFLPALYGYEVMTEGRRYILDENRPYFQILYALLREALQRGELKEDKAAYDQARVIGEIHRGLTYSWLLSECRYSLTDIVQIVLKTYIDSIRA